MPKLLAGLWREESGQGMAEYGLILALVAVACIAMFTNLGTAINTKIQAVNTGLNPPANP